MNLIIGCGMRQEGFSNHDMKLIRFLALSNVIGDFRPQIIAWEHSKNITALKI